MKNVLLMALTLGAFAPISTFASNHCACTEQCAKDCATGKGDECKCKECDCKKTGKCGQGHCDRKNDPNKKG